MSVADERFLLLTVEEDGTVNGLVELTAFLKGEELESILLTAPITFKVEKTDKEKLCYINACVENVYAKPLSLREVEVDLSLNLNYFLEETYEETVITSVTEGEVKEEKNNAISVYIAKKGEELFDMAKRLNSSMEDIIKVNKDLEFPLSGDERIIIYRQERK